MSAAVEEPVLTDSDVMESVKHMRCATCVPAPVLGETIVTVCGHRKVYRGTFPASVEEVRSCVMCADMWMETGRCVHGHVL